MTHYADSMHISEDELISLLLNYAQHLDHNPAHIKVSRDQQLVNLNKATTAVKYVEEIRTNGAKLFKEYKNKAILFKEHKPAAEPVKEFDPFEL